MKYFPLILMMVIIFILLGSSFALIQMNKNYYEELRLTCDGNHDCFVIVDHMKKNNYKLVGENGECPRHYFANEMKGASLLMWCEPMKS